MKSLQFNFDSISAGVLGTPFPAGKECWGGEDGAKIPYLPNFGSNSSIYIWLGQEDHYNNWRLLIMVMMMMMMVMMMMMMMMIMNCFRDIVDQQKVNLISSQDHCQRPSPLWIFDMEQDLVLLSTWVQDVMSEVVQ